jgi:hypothetical protein
MNRASLLCQQSVSGQLVPDPPRKVSKHDDIPMCQWCLGYGWVRIWEAQRPSSVTCDRCDGSGKA